jgi:hypothetical protein
MDFELNLTTTDLTFSGGDLDTITGLEEVAQHVKDRLQSFRTEWFLDLAFGVDYIQDVFKKNPTLTLIQSVLVSQFELSLDENTVLKEFQLTQEIATRKLDVSFVLRDAETEAVAERQVVIG